MHEDGRIAIVVMTTWDTGLDAKQFASAYGALLKNKYAELVHAEAGQLPEGTQVFHCGGDLGHGRTTVRGREFFAVEGLPPELVESVTQKLLAAPVQHVD